MSKLDDLINKLCPDGMEYHKTNSLCEIKTGKGITSKDSTENGEYPIISGGKTPMGYYDKFNREGNTVTVSRVGANAGFVLYMEERFYLNDKCFSIIPFENYKDKINTKYLYYYFKNIENDIIALQSEGGVPTINTQKVGNLEIPVPPLEVQNEIIRILDKFTSLEAELEAELEARRKQYEYYRDSLLTFGDDVEWKTLGEITKYSDTRIKNSDIQPYSYVSVENLLQQKKGVEFTDKIPEGNNSIEYLKEDILIGNIRPYLRKIWKADRNGGTNGDVLTIRILNDYKQRLDSKYIYYQLSSENFFNYDNQHAKGAKMPRGSKDDVMKYQIPIPSLSEQERIVAILDRFESLCNDITFGLPAEIEARHKQYEYYRDKILTFKRKEK